MNEVKKEVIKIINESLICVNTISDFFSYLKKHNVDVIPAGCSILTKKFVAARFLYKGISFPGHVLGNQYSIPSIIKRGIEYDPKRDFEKVKESFFCFTKEQQLSFCKKINADKRNPLLEYLSSNQILKTLFYVEQHIKYKNKDIVLCYETNPDPIELFTNTKLELTSPGRILLKKIEFKNDNLIAELKYASIDCSKPNTIKTYDSLYEGLINNQLKEADFVPDIISEVMQCIYNKHYDSEFVFIKQKLISQDLKTIIQTIPRFSKEHHVTDFVFNTELASVS